MRRHGLIPDKVSYGSILDALCRVGRVDDAMFQFNQMINEGQSSNIYIFTTLIDGFSTCGNWEKVEVLFSEMLDRGIHPNAVFCAMMHNLHKDGRAMEAQKLFDLMAYSGAKPNDIS
jgi:pentatricopeptide repeat protein